MTSKKKVHKLVCVFHANIFTLDILEEIAIYTFLRNLKKYISIKFHQYRVNRFWKELCFSFCILRFDVLFYILRKSIENKICQNYLTENYKLNIGASVYFICKHRQNQTFQYWFHKHYNSLSQTNCTIGCLNTWYYQSIKKINWTEINKICQNSFNSNPKSQ